MRMLLFAAAASLSLAGCTTASIDTAIQSNLPRICSAAETAYLGFLSVDVVHPVSPTARARVERAWDVLVPLCADPTKATSATVLAAAFDAYLSIQAARRG